MNELMKINFIETDCSLKKVIQNKDLG